MRFTVFSLFPDYFVSPLIQSIFGKAISAGIVQIKVVDIRDHAEGRQRQCDDTPYGGGAGMVLKAEPIAAAMRSHPLNAKAGGVRLYLSPRGRPLTQKLVQSYAGLAEVQLLCGRYEGVDQRLIDHYIDEEVSLGDYILNGGEAAALVLMEAIARLVPGVLGSGESTVDESFSSGLLEYPHYTRPPMFEGESVPEVLTSGDHARIRAWRQAESLRSTAQRRPDLLAGKPKTPRTESDQ